MHTQNLKKIIILFLPMLLIACNGFFDKDNIPPPSALAKFQPQITPHLLWSVKAGNGVGNEYLKIQPSFTANTIITTSQNGMVTSVNKSNGRINWQVNTHIPISTGAGVGQNMIVIGSRTGKVIALSQTNGQKIWEQQIEGEMLATPAIANNEVVIKTIDGYIRTLSLQDGHLIWNYQQTEPNLLLRGASSPLIKDGNIIVGFANGNLAKLNLRSGQIVWMQTISVPEGAFAIQRMIDIDADPIIFQHHIYSATYQGKIASLSWDSGKILWHQDISSYTGMIADTANVYISDAKSYVWAFSGSSGEIRWKQTQLAARIVSGPASMGNYLVLGDAEGYLHWLSKQDGHFVGRVSVGNAIYAAPTVENNVLYVFTNNGYLQAYTL